jgi:outer membrane protein assembly factor BamB
MTGKPQGTLLWTSDPLSQWAFYGVGITVYNGRLYNTNGYTGILIAFNATTGHIDWTWSAPPVGEGETPYTNTPLYVGSIADNKMYMFSSEHSVNSPIRRDARMFCVDLTNGKMLWAITCWPSNDPISSTPVIADGRLLVADIQDMEIYCFAPGSSKTTVVAPQTVPELGSSVTITGTVTDDTSTGRHNVNGELDFSLQGTPAISDASMDAWMEYMYHQRPKPTNATGVPVSLDTIDPNGNLVHIGNVTSDATGAYGLVWKPDVPGTYQITATFAGSGAYGGSSAQTYMAIGESTPTASPYPEINIPSTEIYIIGTGIAIIIAVAIVGALILIAVRKRP